MFLLCAVVNHSITLSMFLILYYHLPCMALINKTNKCVINCCFNPTILINLYPFLINLTFCFLLKKLKFS